MGSTIPSDSSFLDPIANDQAAQGLFAVEADSAEYWRMFTLDAYDGVSWTSANLDGTEGVPLSVPATLQPADDRPPGAQTLDQTFRIVGGMGIARALPMAQSAEEIAGSFGDVTWDAARDSVFIDEELAEGMSYSVRSRIVLPTPDELDRVEFHLDPSFDTRWIALPDDLDPRISEIARAWTADATTDYRKVLAIQERFQQGDFVYSEAVDPRVNVYTLLDFLTRTKTGFCAHYSSAMALMVRTLGLPARIGEGFRAGTPQADGSFLVTSRDAHVWVEVWFPGYGWLQFEPEAGTDHPNAQPGNYLDP